MPLKEKSDTAWFVVGKSPKQLDPRYTCNAEYTDNRIWLHASKTPCKCILVMSPDTDMYNIGTPLASVKDKKVAIQVNTYNSKGMKFILLNNLMSA